MRHIARARATPRGARENECGIAKINAAGLMLPGKTPTFTKVLSV
jgi:hypothetical protein